MLISSKNKSMVGRIVVGLFLVIITVLLDLWMFKQDHICFRHSCGEKNLFFVVSFIVIYNGLTLTSAGAFFIEAFRKKK